MLKNLFLLCFGKKFYIAKTTPKNMSKIQQIHDILLKNYGPQGWWPLTERHSFIPVHKGKKPFSQQRKFEIILGAILTQNTAWKNVEKALVD